MSSGNSSALLGGPLNKAPSALVNAHSAAGAAVENVTNIALYANAKSVTSGALTANALATVLNLSGQGVVSVVACGSADATERTHRFKLTIDGIVVFDYTSGSATVNTGVVLIGGYVPGSSVAYELIPFNNTFLLEYASSVSETAKTYWVYKYRMN